MVVKDGEERADSRVQPARETADMYYEKTEKSSKESTRRYGSTSALYLAEQRWGEVKSDQSRHDRYAETFIATTMIRSWPAWLLL